MANEKQIRIGIIGAGRFTNTHMTEFAKVPRAKVVAFSRRSPEALKEMQDRWDVPLGFTDYQDLLARKDIDAVDVVTPTDTHHEIVLEAIKAGKHVLCDKPLGLTGTQCKEMLAAAEEAGVVHCTNFNQRGRTPVGRMQRYIANGYVGTVYHVDVAWWMTLQHDLRPDVTSWRFSPETGGGTVYELIHVFDIARFIGGEVRRIVSMLSTSEPRRPTGDRPEGIAVKVPDSSAFLIEFENGATGVIHTSFVARGTEPDGTTCPRVDVAGSIGRIATDGLYCLRGVSGKQGPLAQLDPGEAYPQPYAQFVNAILTGEPVKTSFLDGLKAAQLVDAAYQSARTGAWAAL
ncbi:MAG: Gfo/Idh/MocA family oxidoreductase [Chloroflexi bacterium]|nr:Gfo/Idh/MocA family oxidoreductase [Chloroflexota bacterium]